MSLNKDYLLILISIYFKENIKDLTTIIQFISNTL